MTAGAAAVVQPQDRGIPRCADIAAPGSAPAAETASSPRRLVGGSGYNVAVAERRDDFPNHFVGDLVPTDRGWVVVPPTCRPAGHAYGDRGWSGSAVWCGAAVYAPQPGPHCRIRDRGPVSMWEDEQERTPGT